MIIFSLDQLSEKVSELQLLEQSVQGEVISDDKISAPVKYVDRLIVLFIVL